MLKQNVRIYSNCSKKALLPDIMEYNPPPTPELNQFWGSAIPRMNTHGWYCVSSVSRFIYSKKRKRSTYRPSQFSGKKGKQTFYFFRPYHKNRIFLKPNDVIMMTSNVHEWKGKLRSIVWYQCLMQQIIKNKVNPMIVKQVFYSA